MKRIDAPVTSTRIVSVREVLRYLVVILRVYGCESYISQTLVIHGSDVLTGSLSCRVPIR